MSACVKFRLDRPSRLAGHTEQTNRQTGNRFYYIDVTTASEMTYTVSGGALNSAQPQDVTTVLTLAYAQIPLLRPRL